MECLLCRLRRPLRVWVSEHRNQRRMMFSSHQSLNTELPIHHMPFSVFEAICHICGDAQSLAAYHYNVDNEQIQLSFTHLHYILNEIRRALWTKGNNKKQPSPAPAHIWSNIAEYLFSTAEVVTLASMVIWWLWVWPGGAARCFQVRPVFLVTPTQVSVSTWTDDRLKA